VDFYTLNGSQALSHNLVHCWEKRVDLFLIIHDLNDDGEVIGQSQNLRRVKPAVRAEAFKPPKDGCPRKAVFTGLAHNPLEKWHASVLVIFTHENSQQFSGLW
jgi:hypothetical protein